MNLQFDHPWLLGLLSAGIVLVGLAYRQLRDMDGLRRLTTLVLRLLFIAALVFALAEPRTLQEHDQLTVIGLLDVSGSVQRFAQIGDEVDLQNRSTIEYLREWFRKATDTKSPDDRFGLIVFDGEAMVISTPVRGEYVDDNLDIQIREGTDIAGAIRLGLAMFPAETAKRLVLVSDGNQTLGDAIDAAKHAAGGSSADNGLAATIPIDVVPIAYNVPGDVQVVRVESPPIARPNQTVTVRIVLDSTRPVTGDLNLFREGKAIDLSAAEPGSARRVSLPQGRSVQLAEVELGENPINRFEAVFEPDDTTVDALSENNRAESITATPSKGSVLYIAGDATEQPGALVRTLEAGGLPVTFGSMTSLPTDLLSMQAYDLIVLDNLSASQVQGYQQMLLADYVEKLGGGLIMTGGRNAFGAGGWNGTPIATLLPVELDIPDELRLPEAALVLVLDKSGSMARPVPGARASQQEVANEGAALAVESLRKESYVGVITFDSFARSHVPLQINDQPKQVARQVRSILPQGGTNIARALAAADEMLSQVNVANKHVVLLTDGQSDPRQLEDMTAAMAERRIRLTTIAVGQDADYSLLKRIAEIGGGEFYPVRDPRVLPRVLVDSVQVVNQPLIKEFDFQPVARSTGSTLTAGIDTAPPLHGLVLTAPRDDPTAIVHLVTPEDDPLLATWQAGLGRVAAFTSQADGPWSRDWLAWPDYDRFWLQLARTIARPAAVRGFDMALSIEDDQLRVDVQADPTQLPDDARYLQIDGTVYTPNGEAIETRLQQVGPLRFEADVPADSPGNYIVTLAPRSGQRRLAPIIGGTTRPRGEEFRRYQSNLALLAEIADITGGRRLSITNPATADIYDRAGRPVSISSLPAWPMVLWAALLLLLLDIACRRIAWNRAMIVAAMRNAVRKVTPARVRGEAAAATLETLRQSDAVSTRQSQREQTKTDRAQSESKPQPAPMKIPPRRETAKADSKTQREQQSSSEKATKQPDSKEVSSALDALLGKQSSGQSKSEEPSKNKDTQQPKESSAAEADETIDQQTDDQPSTGSLLDAKRRARERMRGEELE